MAWWSGLCHGRALRWQGIANPMVAQLRRKQVPEVQKLLPPILHGINGFPDSVQLFQRRTFAISRILENNFEKTWKQLSKWWWARWFMLVGQQLWVKSLESWESCRLYPHLPPNDLIPPFAHTQVKLVFRSHKSFCSFACFPWSFSSLCLLPIFTLPSWPIHPLIQLLYWLFVLVHPISLFWAVRPQSRSLTWGGWLSSWNNHQT